MLDMPYFNPQLHQKKLGYPSFQLYDFAMLTPPERLTQAIRRVCAV